MVDGVHSDWSEVWRFEISAQSRWEQIRASSLGNAHRVAVDPATDVAIEYEISDLYGGQDADYWYFGFDTPDRGQHKHDIRPLYRPRPQGRIWSGCR